VRQLIRNKKLQNGHPLLDDRFVIKKNLPGEVVSHFEKPASFFYL
jgi:hypothetical protein